MSISVCAALTTMRRCRSAPPLAFQPHRVADPRLGGRVERPVRLPRRPRPRVERQCVIVAALSTRDPGDGQLAVLDGYRRLFQIDAAVEPALKVAKALVASTMLERPAHTGEVGRERLRRC